MNKNLYFGANNRYNSLILQILICCLLGGLIGGVGSSFLHILYEGGLLTELYNYIFIIISIVSAFYSFIFYKFYFNRVRKESNKLNNIISKLQNTDQKSTLILDNFDKILLDIANFQMSVTNLLENIDQQRALFAEEKEKADRCKQFIDINSDKLSALEKTLQSVLNTENKKTKASTIMWGVVFCLISFLLGKMF
ncbi:MAG: hypothetical protein KHX31_08595 [Akkermansia sp.]|uniref:hypothetical protein n=1 Tax=Akkermansia sp. TaxID=1872421 RepID=UPI0025C1A537|nr:hypothetical protein [Akkermansia sp.]MBS5508680.1 hypothetical protein [Akkermansia sp.]